MKPISVSAPGKLHLLGEHSVVYGKPALLTAVDKRTTVIITKRKDRFIEIITPDFSETVRVTENQILEKTAKAHIMWKEFFRTNDKTLLSQIILTPIDYVIIAIGEALQHFKKKLSCGLTFSISTSIPFGSGMGSSAALAVSIAGVLSVFFTDTLNLKAINAIAFEAEKKRHGFPSGGDNATSTFGGFIWYQKTETSTVIKKIPVQIPLSMQSKFSLFFTGSPLESTGEMVSFVKAKYLQDTVHMDSLFSHQAILAENIKIAFEKHNLADIKKNILEGEKNLEKIGVVSPFSKKIIQELFSVGVVAKICGAGGVKGPTGVILTIHEDSILMEAIAKKYNVSFVSVRLGQEGVKVE